MKNLFLVMAASLFGLSASAQVLITDAEYLSRRTERVEARAARNSADLKRMDSIVMSKGYRFVPDQFQQMPAGVAHTIYNPNFMLTVKPSYVDIDLPYIQNAVAGPAIITSLNALMPQVQGYAAVQNSDGWTITFQTDAMTEYTYTFTLTIYSLTQEGVLTVATDQFNTVTYQGMVKALF